jgi:hypothetical protein
MVIIFSNRLGLNSRIDFILIEISKAGIVNDWMESKRNDIKDISGKTALIDEEFLSWLSYRIYCVSSTQLTIEIRSPFFIEQILFFILEPIKCGISHFVCVVCFET